MILLGCNITSLLMDRIITSIRFIEKNSHRFNKITWYLSGGIKFDGTISESDIMHRHIDQRLSSISSISSNKTIEYIIDKRSTNTAENLYSSSRYLNTTSRTFDNVYIITSKYHYERAKLMMSLIDSSRRYHWILADMQQIDSVYWERIHIRNVEKDVHNIMIE